ncbi:MAG: copper chaperone PCu(A)C [Candidatus Competibacteraceae bacterium]
MMRRLLVLFIPLLISSQGLAAEFAVGDLVIKQPWARPTPPVANAGAAYFTVDNTQGQDDRLLSAEAAISERVELHTHLMDGDVVMMRKLDTVEVPAGQTVAFQPGGLHVMFIGLQAPLVEGNRFPLTLNFEQAGAVTVEVAIGQEPDAQ